VPVLEDIVGWVDPVQVRAFFESHALQVQEWDKMQVDLVTIREGSAGAPPERAEAVNLSSAYDAQGQSKK
jgi:hypothetical protein